MVLFILSNLSYIYYILLFGGGCELNEFYRHFWYRLRKKSSYTNKNSMQKNLYLWVIKSL